MRFAALTLGFLLTTLPAHAGNELGNGGDGFAQEFVALGRRLVAELPAHPDAKIKDPAALARAVEETRVVTASRLELRGAEVDAINHRAEKKIELSRSRWEDYDVRQKASLVLHEYLGVAGPGDENYEISSAFLELPLGPLLADSNGSASRLPSNETVANAGAAEPSAHWWWLGLGTARGGFGGNIGKLYGADDPLMPEARLGILLGRVLSARLSVSRDTYEFSATSVGLDDVRLLHLTGQVDVHFLGNPRWNGGGGFSPYLSLGLENVFRQQSYSSLNLTAKDTAFGLTGGLGLNYFFAASRAALWLDGRLGSLFFRDRYSQTFLDDGIPDTTGTYYAASAGLQVYF